MTHHIVKKYNMTKMTDKVKISKNTQIEFSNIQYETYGDNSILNELPCNITYTLGQLQWQTDMDLDDCIAGIDNASNMLVDEFGYEVIGYDWKISK